MAESIPVLWPDDISVDVVAPLAILRAQVEPLQRKTKGLICVEISTMTSMESVDVAHSMELVAPSLNHYRHQILIVRHFRDRVYPAKMEAECFLTPEEPRDFEGKWGPTSEWQPSFIESLRFVLKSSQVRSMIDSMLARINEATPPHSVSPEFS